jgi:hypothetical protein
MQVKYVPMDMVIWFIDKDHRQATCTWLERILNIVADVHLSPWGKGEGQVERAKYAHDI